MVQLFRDFKGWQRSVEKNVKELPYGQQIFPLLVASLSFFTMQLTTQRICGTIGMHCARPLAAGIGCFATAANLYCADRSALAMSRWARLQTPPIDWRRDREESLSRVIMGVSAFVILERGFFRTALPSSVTDIGAYARDQTLHSIATKNIKASPAEKEIVQRLGSKYGCHHCGKRPLFGTNYIADHMPPTKHLADMPIRKQKNIQQRLWPQCGSCHLKQGPAVRNEKQVLVYHAIFRRFHFAPAFALLLDADPGFRRINRTLYEQLKATGISLMRSWKRQPSR